MPKGIKGFQKGNVFGKLSKGKKLSQKIKQKLRVANKRKHLSRKTEFKKNSIPWNRNKKLPQFSGKNHPNWKGGINSVQDIRWCAEYQEWRLKIFKRDRYICQKCKKNGSRKNPLHAHHLVKLSESIELAFELSNGKTLCRNCHLKIHLAGSTH